MITRLRFKNWRSLRDVEIDKLTPITVFVGANSSGKSNIVDGLKFLRYTIEHGEAEGAFVWGWASPIHTTWISSTEPIELEVTLTDSSGQYLIHNLSVALPISEQHAEISTDSSRKVPPYVTQRWQILDEDFTTPSRIEDEPLDLYVVHRKAHNVPMMLDFMRLTKPEVYAQLQEDLGWLLEHVDTLETQRAAHEIRLLLHEKQLGGEIAPTISGGTARIIAMLTAMYVLDMTNPELPGLVVIEEPDTAVHPLLLQKLVELFRTFVDNREGNRPRQLILTTHNPRFLNLFEPEEVRIVERDEKGETTVKSLAPDILDSWNREYGLGDIWVTRILGGVPD
jgi:predicted ATPase